MSEYPLDCYFINSIMVIIRIIFLFYSNDTKDIEEPVVERIMTVKEVELQNEIKINEYEIVFFFFFIMIYQLKYFSYNYSNYLLQKYN